MLNPIAHLALYDTLADWEVGHLLAELRTGRFTGTPFEVVTVAESREPITTMGGVRMLPDALLAELLLSLYSYWPHQHLGLDWLQVS